MPVGVEEEAVDEAVMIGREIGRDGRMLLSGETPRLGTDAREVPVAMGAVPVFNGTEPLDPRRVPDG